MFTRTLKILEWVFNLFSCGCTLLADELYKIDKTEMADIIAKERNTAGPESKQSEEEIVKEEELVEEEEKEGEEKDEEMKVDIPVDGIDLESILSACNVIEKQTSKNKKLTKVTVVIAS